jgi:hypothetical protein
MPRTIVVGGFFDSIVHAFKHIADDVARKLGPVVPAMFGLPPEVVGPLAALLIKAHAGSKKAKAKVDHLQAHGGTFHGLALSGEQLAPALQRINIAVNDHPHFSAMKAHAAARVQKAQAHAAAAHS